MSGMSKSAKIAFASFAIATAVFVGAGCGNNGSTPESNGGGDKPAPTAKVAGQVSIDGSTTVYPISEAMAEEFQNANSDVKVSVGKKGTGSGFKEFIAGNVQITGASRPIDPDEDKQLKEKGIEYFEIPLAFDGVTVIVNPENTWATNMTVDDLHKAWMPGSTVKTWKDINPAWPADPVTFYGPTDNHGTYEYFTEAICKTKNEIRDAYEANQEYTAIVQSVAGNKNSIGYCGFNYYDENKEQVHAVTVEGIGPSETTIADGTYKPLSRPLFMYVAKKAYESDAAVKAYVDFALSDAGLEGVTTAKYVKLPAEAYEKIRARVAAGTTGTVFMNAQPGSKVLDLLK